MMPTAEIERYADQLRRDAKTTDDGVAVGLLRAADGLGDLIASAVDAARPSVHPTITKSYAIDQITDVEHLRRVAHLMWEAFRAAHKQHGHTLRALTEGECEQCLDAINGERETGCAEYQELQRLVSRGFGSI